MVYSYTPTYYSSLHDSITSICKNILPFSFKKRKLPAIAAAELKLSEQQSDHLKWQQESFHQILKLIGLCQEGIVPETEVSAFRAHILHTLVAPALDYEQPTIVKDKLIFLQELLHAKCITEDEYHSSKRPLLERLAVQGVEIEPKYVTMKGGAKESSNEEWSEIDLKDEKCLLRRKGGSNSKNKSLQSSSSASSKQMKGSGKTVLGFISSSKSIKVKEEKGEKEFFKKNEQPISTENPFWDNQVMREKENETKSILMSKSLHSKTVKVEKQSVGDRAKKKPFRTLFQREERGEEHSESDNQCPPGHHSEEKAGKSGKKQQWLFKKWKKSDCDEDETAPLPLGGERSDGENYLGRLVENPTGEGPDTKEIKRKLHPSGAPSDFFVDEVLADKIKKELSRFQTELNGENQNVKLTDEQIEAISTRIPVDMADLMKFLPRSWCDHYGQVVLDVVRKEFKTHIGEMGISQRIKEEKQSSNKWATFEDDDENFHPNLFTPRDNNKVFDGRSITTNSSIDKGFKYNPFFEM